MSARDPGLQPERTGLAWARTAMAMLVNALLLLRSAALADSQVLMLVSAALAAASLVMFLHARQRGAELARLPQRAPYPRLVVLTSGACVLAILAGLVEIVAAWPY